LGDGFYDYGCTYPYYNYDPYSCYLPAYLRIPAKNNEALRRTAADPVAHRAYLLRASLIDSVRKRAAAAA